MNQFAINLNECQRYRLSGRYRTLLLIASVFCIAGGAFSLLLSQKEPLRSSWPFVSGAAAMIVAGIYCGVSVFARTIRFTPEAVSVHGIFRNRTISLRDIRGRRTSTVHSHFVTYTFITLESNNPNDRSITTIDAFNFDDAWASWIAELPNLDEFDREAVLDAISADQTLGDNANDRLQKLKQARVVAISLSLLAILSTAANTFLGHLISHSIFYVSELVLVLIPWVAIWLQFTSPLLYNTLPRRRDPRANLSLILLSALGLPFNPFLNIQRELQAALILYAIVPAILLSALYLRITDNRSRRRGSVLVLLLFSLAYGYGLAHQVNTQLDDSTPRSQRVKVLEKSISNDHSTVYFFQLSPWDQHPLGKRIAVPTGFYNSIDPGQAICVSTHAGALNVSWYAVIACE